MNVFCNEASCQVIGLENIFFLYCCKKGYSKNRFLVNSRIFYMEKNNEMFIKDIRTLLIPPEKEIVLIDCENSLDLASKVYWSLKAAGFTDVKILLDEPRSLPSIEGEIEEVSRSESPFLPFNNSIVLTKTDLESKTSFYQQLVHVESLDLLISEDFLKMSTSEAGQVLQSKGVKFSPSRSSIVFGKRAGLAGILLSWVTSRSVSVVIDEVDRRPTIERKEKNAETSEEVKKTPDAYSVTIDEHLKSISAKPRPKTERDSAVCANCLVF